MRTDIKRTAAMFMVMLMAIAGFAGAGAALTSDDVDVTVYQSDGETVLNDSTVTLPNSATDRTFIVEAVNTNESDQATVDVGFTLCDVEVATDISYCEQTADYTITGETLGAGATETYEFTVTEEELADYNFSDGDTGYYSAAVLESGSPVGSEAGSFTWSDDPLSSFPIVELFTVLLVAIVGFKVADRVS